MTANPYQNLGWNPVPGIPSEVHSLQQKITSAAKALRSCHNQIEKLIGESSYWQGDAANKFREALDGELPTYVKNAARSLEKAAAALKKWDGELSSNRDLARKYDDEAGEKKSTADKAKQHHEGAKQDPDLKLANKQFPSQAEADAATVRLRTAERNLAQAAASLTQANEAYNGVIKKARALETHHSEQASIVAKSLSDATDKLAPKEPGWLEDIGNFIMDGLKLVKEHAGTIGAICGLLALLPTPLAPVFAGIAIAASVVSLGSNLSDPKFLGKLVGQGSGMDTFSAWASVGGDLLGMVPGGKALGTAGKEIGDGLRMADEMGVAVSKTEKVTEFTREFGHVFKSTARSDAYGAWAAAGESSAGSAKLMGNISANGLNVAANVESSLESMGKAPEEGVAHNVAEITKAGTGAYGLAGLLGAV
ncbi:putative T7SS-secreted protein [Streptomyces winkii]|uniref:putative T7SS-secreted protein n=1 Tax=Streptomyces winkii TaxID=3051178 RepID=UPI0028D6358D|nr:hypothetical protein [Streptomyces sp. DSM 40971]